MKMKTISDLINELQQYPQDAIIVDMYGNFFEGIEYREDICLGNPANPLCEVTKGYALI